MRLLQENNHLGNAESAMEQGDLGVFQDLLLMLQPHCGTYYNSCFQ